MSHVAFLGGKGDPWRTNPDCPHPSLYVLPRVKSIEEGVQTCLSKTQEASSAIPTPPPTSSQAPKRGRKGVGRASCIRFRFVSALHLERPQNTTHLRQSAPLHYILYIAYWLPIGFCKEAHKVQISKGHTRKGPLQ